MSKITFRADEELIDELERFDASKSEVMREALREFLDADAPQIDDVDTSATDGAGEPDTLEELIADRVDTILAEKLDDAFTRPRQRGVDVTISVDGAAATEETVAVDERKTKSDGRPSDTARDSEGTSACQQCGESLESAHVYCPNCGEKAAGRIFCECGDELRSDWAFCPGCGRRTPAADVLDQA